MIFCIKRQWDHLSTSNKKLFDLNKEYIWASAFRCWFQLSENSRTFLDIIEIGIFYKLSVNTLKIALYRVEMFDPNGIVQFQFLWVSIEEWKFYDNLN